MILIEVGIYNRKVESYPQPVNSGKLEVTLQISCRIYH